MEKHWPEWQEKVRAMSTDKLDDMLMDYTESLNALGLLQWQDAPERKAAQAARTPERKGKDREPDLER